MSYPADKGGFPFVQYEFERLSEEEQLRRAREFFELMNRRRSVRQFSAETVPREVVINCIRTAATAPSGAHKQPWRFVLVEDPELKKLIREAAEKEEYVNYEKGRLPESWLKDLAPLGTDWRKPFLETAPYLIVMFALSKKPVYYLNESVGIAAGFLIAALHNAGLVTLTHTPSPMGFLRDLLGRPTVEKPYLLLPVGYPADEAVVPDTQRKPLGEVLVIK